MSEIIIGIDPDSKKHGVAIYEYGKLTHLFSASLLELFSFIEGEYVVSNYKKFEAHIEDVNGISSNTFHVYKKDSLPVKLKKAEHVGKCKQAQLELERMLEYFEIKIVHHKVSKQWKDSATGKEILKRLTGWDKQSNEDTRSAAYFGFLGLK